MPNIIINQMVAMINLIGNFFIAACAWTGNIHHEIYSRYIEKWSLTNLFIEHKFGGGEDRTSFNLRIDSSNILFPISVMENRGSRQKILIISLLRHSSTIISWNYHAINFHKFSSQESMNNYLGFYSHSQVKWLNRYFTFSIK